MFIVATTVADLISTHRVVINNFGTVVDFKVDGDYYHFCGKIDCMVAHKNDEISVKVFPA